MSRLAVLVEVVDRYGPAIEYDLHQHLGLDLLDFFRHKHSWMKLDRLIWQLPSGSAFWAARTDDDEAAKAMLERHGDKPRPRAVPPLTEMTRTNQVLLDIVDWLQLTVDRLERLGGNKPPVPERAPRPTSALERVEHQQEAAAVADLVAEAYAAQERARMKG